MKVLAAITVLVAAAVAVGCELGEEAHCDKNMGVMYDWCDDQGYCCGNGLSCRQLEDSSFPGTYCTGHCQINLPNGDPDNLWMLWPAWECSIDGVCSLYEMFSIIGTDSWTGNGYCVR